MLSLKYIIDDKKLDCETENIRKRIYKKKLNQTDYLLVEEKYLESEMKTLEKKEIILDDKNISEMKKILSGDKNEIQLYNIKPYSKNLGKKVYLLKNNDEFLLIKDDYIYTKRYSPKYITKKDLISLTEENIKKL